MIGKSSSTLDGADRATLKGPRCEGATHFVHSATLGAFAMKSAAAGEASAKAVVDVFGGAGASASSQSNRSTLNKDGDIDACTGADTDSETAPRGCAALLRVRLLPISEGAVAAKSPAQEAPKEIACPAGLVASEGKCAPKETVKAHDCDLTDTAAECETQCTNGSGESCGVAALDYLIGLNGAADDDAKAMELSKKGCTLEDNFSCDSVADSLVKSDKPKAIELYTKSCKGGYDQSCLSLGKLYSADGDGPSAARYLDRACDAGESEGCLEAAQLYTKGATGLRPDVAKATGYFTTVCYDDKVVADACYNAAMAYEKGNGVAADKTRAKALYKRACDHALPRACDRMSKLK